MLAWKKMIDFKLRISFHVEVFRNKRNILKYLSVNHVCTFINMAVRNWQAKPIADSFYAACFKYVHSKFHSFGTHKS